MKRFAVCIILFFFFSVTLFATHNRAGEITYKQTSGYIYEFTVITYTYTPSAANKSRDELTMNWGDGSVSNIPRISEEFLPDNFTLNTYKTTHSFSGPGTYVISMEDPNRNEGVINIVESVNVPFSISTTLRIDAILGGNTTPVLTNPPVDNAAIGVRFIHNPAAYDADGDSLAYRLTTCSGENGDFISGYSYPMTSKDFYVDAVSGDLVWDAPVVLGSYNVAMVIEEWRKGTKISEIVRDMQIEVYDADNTVPKIETLSDVCVRVGDTVRFQVIAVDADSNNITLTASGGPFEVGSKADFSVVSNEPGKIVSEFTWIPTCDEIREQSYMVLFKAVDDDKVALADMKYVNIKVIGHPPVELSADAQSVSVYLQWKDSVCASQIQSYDIYRSKKSIDYVPEYCEFGLPDALDDSYEKIATVAASQKTYFDNNNGLGLTPGFTYCYRLCSVFSGNYSSYISQEVCTQLIPSAPVITNVSVQKTHEKEGEIFVAWSISREFDSIKFPEPYQYWLYQSSGLYGEYIKKIAEIDGIQDTTYIDKNLNTYDSAYSYRVEFYSLASGTPILIGVNPVSSSPRLDYESYNHKIRLLLTTNVGWENDTVYVYRKNSDVFDSLGIFVNGEFWDNGLENQKEYCYYVTTSGYFDYKLLPQRVYNNSQMIYAIPADTIPPKSMNFKVSQDCENLSRTITWKIDDDDEIKNVNVYFKDCSNMEWRILSSVSGSATSYVHDFIDSVSNMAGCYYVAAEDSAGNIGLREYDTCLYNCPQYSLPNVFTPNGDGENDLFHPTLNRFVQKVDMKMYDAWGQLVFATENPELNWNGHHYKTEKTLTDGVFYYVCDVYEYWSDCEIHKRELSGFVHKFSDGKK
ncbi:MAG: gliding motility-associated C-terminal domain-containing protein [Bacteroidales bacterium]|nr:gliding motility-associated C-terminal domain-containing protein [Bacteroidales bacterium]